MAEGKNLVGVDIGPEYHDVRDVPAPLQCLFHEDRDGIDLLSGRATVGQDSHVPPALK